MIQHGWDRVGALPASTVALPTFKVVRGGEDGVYGPVVSTPAELRVHFRLNDHANILLVSVAKDRALERFWRDRETFHVARALSRLGVMAATVPNFSFFSDVPRTHTLWNRTRICRIAEEFSEAGLMPILHLNAQTRADWNFWLETLEEHSSVYYVAKEFQTGLARQPVGSKAVADLADLQNRIGRPLHVIAVGGAQYFGALSTYFSDRVSIVDSAPFMKAMKRRVAEPVGGRLRWRKLETGPGEPLDTLLHHNVEAWAATFRPNLVTKLTTAPSLAPTAVALAPGQFEFHFASANP